LQYELPVANCQSAARVLGHDIVATLIAPKVKQSFRCTQKHFGPHGRFAIDVIVQSRSHRDTSFNAAGDQSQALPFIGKQPRSYAGFGQNSGMVLALQFQLFFQNLFVGFSERYKDRQSPS